VDKRIINIQRSNRWGIANYQRRFFLHQLPFPAEKIEAGKHHEKLVPGSEDINLPRSRGL